METENASAVNVPPVSLAAVGPSIPHTPLPPVADVSIPILRIFQPSSQPKQMTSAGFGGFKFQGNFSSMSRPEYTMGAISTQSCPRLDGHPRRITPLLVSVVDATESDAMKRGCAQVAKRYLAQKFMKKM